MSNTNTGGPAFPSKKRVYRAGYATAEFEPVDGMDLRDYFAAKAMQVLIRSAPNGTRFGASSEATNSTYAVASYAVADAMLKARET